MSFETLLGNDRLKKNLTESLARGHISHFYLISGPKGSGKHTLANLLAEAILCEGSRKPCGNCAHCRKMRSHNHPDFIT
ncbi:MAG: AAA family ATPase, partial [Thermoguttaceae bacterium]|nr:AAA family ATPase [Thermoguttaceae bacterium]